MSVMYPESKQSDEQKRITKFLSSDYPLPYGPPTETPSFYDLKTWPNDPMQMFSAWYADAEREFAKHDKPGVNIVHWPNTMQIATVDASGFPCVRTVLLKGVDHRGFIFFTNYHGAKGRQLDAFPQAALGFYWKILERQIRVEGSVERLSAEESDAYFHSRPIQSQVSAMTSPQSQVIPTRAYLEQTYMANVRAAAREVVKRCQQQGAAVAKRALNAIEPALQEIEQVNSNSNSNSTTSSDASSSSSGVAHSGSSDSLDAIKNFTATLPEQDQYDQNNPPSPTHAHHLHELALSTLNRIESDPELSHHLHGVVERPSNWGGYLIRPRRMEFWADGIYRLHSRVQYTAVEKINDKVETKDKTWKLEFLAP